jgi:hypothetical protein
MNKVEKAPQMTPVHVHRPQPSERQPRHVAQERRIVELGRDERADRREEQQPAQTAGEPLSDQIGVDQLVVSRRGFTQSGVGHTHPSLRARIARSPAYPNRMGCDASSSAPRQDRIGTELHVDAASAVSCRAAASSEPSTS